jgi:hypothetical protein
VRRVACCCFAGLLLQTQAFAAERWTIGLSTSGAPIEAVVVDGRSETAPTVLLVAGLQGRDPSTDAVTREVAAFDAMPRRRRAFRLIAIAAANPDAQPLQFPPSGVAYRAQIESHVLWRWTGLHAPDLVLVAGPDPGLTDALSQQVVADVGQIPARRVDASTRFLQSLAAPRPSSARQEIDRRLKRSPRAFAAELAAVYGRDFAQPNYIAAMAVISRLRLGERDDVAALLVPYLEGSRDSFARPSQSSLAAPRTPLSVPNAPPSPSGAPAAGNPGWRAVRPRRPNPPARTGPSSIAWNSAATEHSGGRPRSAANPASTAER